MTAHKSLIAYPWVIIPVGLGLLSCDCGPEIASMTVPTEIAIGMEYRKAQGILLGGGAVTTEFAMVPADRDKQELHAFDMPDGSAIVLVVTKADSLIVRMTLCGDSARLKGDREWVAAKKFMVDPRKASLRWIRLDSGMAYLEAARYLSENGAVKIDEKIEESDPEKLDVWHTYRLADGREFKFWVKKGYPGAWDIQIRGEGKEWIAPGRIWLKPMPKKANASG